jgi:NADPH-dependent curcumin reductase CurA
VYGIPDYVPKFTYGALDKSQSKIVEGSISSVFNLCFNGVIKTDLDAYAEVLKSKGFVVAIGEIGSTYTLTASLERDREIATLVITLAEAKGIAVFTLGAPV